MQFLPASRNYFSGQGFCLPGSCAVTNGYDLYGMLFYFGQQLLWASSQRLGSMGIDGKRIQDISCSLRPPPCIQSGTQDQLP